MNFEALFVRDLHFTKHEWIWQLQSSPSLRKVAWNWEKKKIKEHSNSIAYKAKVQLCSAIDAVEVQSPSLSAEPQELELSDPECLEQQLWRAALDQDAGKIAAKKQLREAFLGPPHLCQFLSFKVYYVLGHSVISQINMLLPWCPGQKLTNGSIIFMQVWWYMGYYFHLFLF